MATPIELAWAAGLFEGEGTVRINKPTRKNLGTLVVSVVNTDREVVNFFAARWPGKTKPATGLGPRQRPAWVWTTTALQAAAFLRDIAPYVVRTRVKARIVHGLSFQAGKSTSSRINRSDEYIQAQVEAYWWMRELNARGRRVECPDVTRLISLQAAELRT